MPPKMNVAKIKNKWTIVCPKCGHETHVSTWAIAHSWEDLFGECESCKAKLKILRNTIGKEDAA